MRSLWRSAQLDAATSSRRAAGESRCCRRRSAVVGLGTRRTPPAGCRRRSTPVLLSQILMRNLSARRRPELAVRSGQQEAVVARAVDRAGALVLGPRAGDHQPLVGGAVEVQVAGLELELGLAVRDVRALLGTSRRSRSSPARSPCGNCHRGARRRVDQAAAGDEAAVRDRRPPAACSSCLTDVVVNVGSAHTDLIHTRRQPGMRCFDRDGRRREEPGHRFPISAVVDVCTPPT